MFTFFLARGHELFDELLNTLEFLRSSNDSLEVVVDEVASSHLFIFFILLQLIEEGWASLLNPHYRRYTAQSWMELFTR